MPGPNVDEHVLIDLKYTENMFNFSLIDCIWENTRDLNPSGGTLRPRAELVARKRKREELCLRGNLAVCGPLG